MVDITTYKRMHPATDIAKNRLKDGIGRQAMENDAPPDDKFVLLLPSFVYGFNMQEKEWSMCELICKQGSALINLYKLNFWLRTYHLCHGTKMHLKVWWLMMRPRS
jgi:hypothetical protein